MTGRTLAVGAPTGTVGGMKIDGGISGAGAGGLAAIGESARQLEQAGYAGAWTAETSHDPFLPHMLAAEHTQRIELGTSIAVAFARNPMLLANLGHDLQRYTNGRFILGLGTQIKPHITKRFSMEWSNPAARMREMISAIRAIWSTWNEGNEAGLPWRLLPTHPHDALLRSGPQRVWPTEGVPGCGRAAHE